MPVDLQREGAANLVDGKEPRPLVYSSTIAGNYFETLGIPLLQGRQFNDGDRSESPRVAIVNETLAHRFWPGESPIGKYLKSADGTRVTVVGLARDSKYGARDEEPLAFAYRPLAQDPPTTPTFLVKTATASESFAGLVRAQIASMGAEFVAYNVMALEERLKPIDHVAVAWVSGVLGLFGLLVGAIGTYGLASFSVYERRREIALRLALGATRSAVARVTTRQGMIWAVTGVLLGLAGVLAGAQFLTAFLRGISPFDPVSYGIVATLLLGVTYAACVVPAVRMSRRDPFAMLRE
jgi:hypothetical protein